MGGRKAEDLMQTTLARNGPFVIGGLGGSATRVYSSLLQHAGFYMGEQLNSSQDNLWVTLLLKRRYELLEDPRRLKVVLGVLEKKLATGGRLSLPEHVALWRIALDVSRRGHSYKQEGRGSWAWCTALRIARSTGPKDLDYRGWGFKEPNTHVFLKPLAERFPRLRFMYVVRHGLDMAFSGNVAQLHAWGQRYGVRLPEDEALMPAAQLDYWIAATEEALASGRELLGDRFLVVRYDELTEDPDTQLAHIARWLGLNGSCFDDPAARQWTRPSPSQGRYRNHDLSQFTSGQLARVEEFGFDLGRARE